MRRNDFFYLSDDFEFTIVSDLFPKQVVATVKGFATSVSIVGGMLMALFVGYLLNESGTNG